MFLTKWFYRGHLETMARPSFSPKNVTPKQHYLLGTVPQTQGTAATSIKSFSRVQVLQIMRISRGWLSIIMHITDLGNDFIYLKEGPLLPHLLRVTEGKAVLTYVTCVLEAWDSAS